MASKIDFSQVMAEAGAGFATGAAGKGVDSWDKGLCPVTARGQWQPLLIRNTKGCGIKASGTGAFINAGALYGCTCGSHFGYASIHKPTSEGPKYAGGPAMNRPDSWESLPKYTKAADDKARASWTALVRADTKPTRPRLNVSKPTQTAAATDTSDSTQG